MLIFEDKNFLEYMSDVLKCDAGISALNEQWDNIKLLCEINCPTQAGKILPHMTKVQENFYELQQKLVHTLTTETLNKRKQKIISKAQVAIDILIRNLYERTADVGFIATDDDITRFVSREDREGTKNYILNRLREYVAKYSVYDEIILLDLEGTVLLNLDQSNPIAGKTLSDPVLDRAYGSNSSFEEHFCPSALQSGKRNAHIFTSKILNESGEAVGLVCLCFRFEDEVTTIFQKLSDDYDGSVILIVDEDSRVLASSNETHIPAGITVETGEPGENSVAYYLGMAYICQTLPTKGYQGYLGQGWKGCIMIPLHLAFKEKKSKLVKGMNPEILAGLMSKADSFSEELKQIVLQTEQINHSLKQIVFNGQILAHDDGHNDEYSRLKPLLNTIGRIGVNTSQLFGQSIKNLFATVISTSLDSAGFLASLAVDIMDRNLYERSDDCRWWALNPLFRGILSKDRLEEEDQRLLTKVLGYINRLYTVYSNLVLFDKTGTIVAVSNPEREGDIGISLSGEYIHQLLGNSNPERYFVSPFEKTELYDNRHTYIYGASITDSSGPSRIVGGIGIIFDSEFELHGMLKDAIETKKNAYAVFTDRSKKIISTTNPDLKIGNKLQLPAEFFELANGVSRSDVLAIDGAYYAVGCACSSSYRGYKNKDGYRNDVLAFVFERLAETNGENTAVIQNFGVSQSEVTLSQQQAHVKMATFRLDCHTFAVERSAALEAVDSQAVIYVPGMNDVIRGAVLYNNRFISVINTRMLLGIEDRGETPTQILILQLSDEIRVALEVDELSNILEVNESDIKSVPRIGRVASIVKGIYCIHNEAKRSVLMMNHDVLLEKINSTISKEELERALEYAKELSEEEKFIR